VAQNAKATRMKVSVFRVWVMQGSLEIIDSPEVLGSSGRCVSFVMCY
jgi:hypothetical protein